MSDERIFYVYEHWRPDTGVCFYVGKGKDRRAYSMQRRNDNAHYASIAEKLKAAGLSVEVRIVRSGLSEAEAFAFEIEHIAELRVVGVGLCNQTLGGDGASGRKLSEEHLAKLKARAFSDAWRRKISAAKKGVPVPEERRVRIAATLTGKKRSADAIRKTAEANRGKKRSADVCAKISEAKRGIYTVSPAGQMIAKEKQRDAARAQWASADGRQKILAARAGRVYESPSEETKRKIAATLTGRPNLALKGKPLSDEHRQKMRDAWTRRKARKNSEVAECQS